MLIKSNAWKDVLMDYDIIVSGGGIAGLTAAAAFGNQGFSVLCVDPSPPVVEQNADGADLRTTAFLQPARSFLVDADLWSRLAPHATPLDVMRIIDAGGEEPTPRVIKNFVASDVGDLPFGWNFPNWLLRREILHKLNGLDTVTFAPGVKTTTLFTREGEARVGLSNGTRARAKLLVAADGRFSPMRSAAGINVKTTRYGQKAMVFAVSHERPHDNVSTEIHRTGGPFTLVPLPDQNGKPCSAVVWMDEGPNTLRRAQMSVAEFEGLANRRSCNVLGQLRLITSRSVWPIISQCAETLVAERVALVAEAAHVVPPIGAQGLNMSLADLSALLDLAVKSPITLGDRAMLDAYNAKRIGDIRTRVAGITLLNRTSMLSTPILRDARASGLNALYGIKPLRKTLMQMGLGAKT